MSFLGIPCPIEKLIIHSCHFRPFSVQIIICSSVVNKSCPIKRPGWLLLPNHRLAQDIIELIQGGFVCLRNLHGRLGHQLLRLLDLSFLCPYLLVQLLKSHIVGSDTVCDLLLGE